MKKLLVKPNGIRRVLNSAAVLRSRCELITCLYEITENRLKLLMPMEKNQKEFPIELKSTRENGTGLWTFERVREVAPFPRTKQMP